MTKREWQIEMANRFAKSDRAKDRFPNYESICLKCGVTIYKPYKELTDEEIHDLMDEIRQAVGDDIERAMYHMARAILRKAQEK